MIDRRNEIKQRKQAATKGPWRYESYASGTRCVSMPDRRALYEYRNQKCECHPAEAMHWVNAPHDDQEVLNLRFIAHSREDIPYLLTELERVEAERDSYRQALEKQKDIAQKIYYSAHWQADRDVDEAGLWTEFRDVFGFTKGESPKQNGNYKQAAEMMGWCLEIFDEVHHEYIYSKGPNNYIFTQEWNPLEDRNQAYQLLKRAEELGLAEKVAFEIECNEDCPDVMEGDYSFGMSGCSCAVGYAGVFWLLTCPTNIIVKACVDVWQAWQAEQKAKAAFSRPPVWEEDFPKPATFSKEAKEKFDQKLDAELFEGTKKDA